MGLPAKLLAEGETPLLVLRPHVRRLLRPTLVLLVLAPAAAYAAGAVPPGATQPTVRAVVAAVAALVAARWVVWPFALWWNNVYVLTDERLFERAGIVRRTGHDLPLRKVTDVVVAQRLGERVLRSGTLSVTTEGGAQFTVTDVPGVSRLQHGLLAVADDVAERFAAPPRRRRRARAGEEPAGRYLEIGPADPPDDELFADDDIDDTDDIDEPGRPDRREVRRRERENARRLRALQAQVRRAPVPDSPVEDDAAPPAPPAPPAPSDGDREPGEGARILRFPPRP
jgi:PH (Pleckstrin Homology) domain-containing protein